MQTKSKQYLHNEVEVEVYMFRMDKSLLGKSHKSRFTYGGI